MCLIGTANPEQLAILSEAFDEYCLVRNVIDDNGKEDAARMIFLLFEGGARTAEEIRLRLQRFRQHLVRRLAVAAFAALPAGRFAISCRCSPRCCHQHVVAQQPNRLEKRDLALHPNAVASDSFIAIPRPPRTNKSTGRGGGLFDYAVEDCACRAEHFAWRARLRVCQRRSCQATHYRHPEGLAYPSPQSLRLWWELPAPSPSVLVPRRATRTLLRPMELRNEPLGMRFARRWAR